MDLIIVILPDQEFLAEGIETQGLGIAHRFCTRSRPWFCVWVYHLITFLEFNNKRLGGIGQVVLWIGTAVVFKPGND